MLGWCRRNASSIHVAWHMSIQPAVWQIVRSGDRVSLSEGGKFLVVKAPFLQNFFGVFAKFCRWAADGGCGSAEARGRRWLQDAVYFDEVSPGLLVRVLRRFLQ